MRITAIDRVQLAMPAGQEKAAREFYARTLGIPEVPNPPELAKHGGAWFQLGAVKIHAKGHEIVRADGVPGWLRVHVADPFGNRELMEVR